VFLRNLQEYIDAASDDREIGVVVSSIETSKVIATSYDILANVSDYGELMISIAL
jgi:hypothetical protein